MTVADENDQTGLREYALHIWSRKIVVVIVFIVAVGGTLGYCVLTKATYTGTSEVLLTPTLSPTLLEASGGLTQNQVVDVASDSQVIESAVVKGLVQRQIPTAGSATVTQIGTTDVVQISTSSSKAETAASAANTYAKQYIAFEQSQTLKTLNSGIDLINKHISTLRVAINSLNTQINAATTAGAAAGLQSQLNVLNQENAQLQQELANYQFFLINGSGTQSGQIISFASVPTKPSSPKTVEWTVIAALIGILLGIGAAMLAESLAEGPKTVRGTTSSATS